MKKAFAIAALAASTLAASAAQYSKLGIVSAVKRLGRVERMNAWIQAAGYWDEWLACQVFADDYPGFDAITNAVVASGLVTGAEAEAILDESRIEKSGPAEIDALLLLVENNKKLREQFHGGRIGTYVVTNDSGRLVRVDLYADGNFWTNGVAEAVRALADPEAEAKRLAALAEERERVLAAWEAANLPPELAELRARQRARERENASVEE